jgi:ELWxxDGT repeat protein
VFAAADISLPSTGSPSALDNLVVFNDRLYFAAAIGEWPNNATLYSWDGVAPAPSKVVETTATTTAPLTPTDLRVVNGKLMFSARHESTTGSSNEPWLSDGTAAGTRQIIDLTGRATGSSINGIYNADGRLFFNGTPSLTSSNFATRLWTYGGEGEGVSAVAELYPTAGNNFRPVAHIGNVYLYETTYPVGLWRSDGTVAGTYQLMTMSTTGVGDFAELGGVAYFPAASSGGYELWRSDGTAAGTWRVTDLNPGSGSLNDGTPRPPMCLTTLGDAIYFSITSGATRGLWKSDGTAEGTVLVKEFNGEAPAYLTVANGVLYFAASHDSSGNVLWKSDGTEVGTVVVKQSAPPGTITPRYSNTPVNQPLAVLLGEVFFIASNALWKTDGSDEGTILVKDGQPYGSTFFQQYQLYPNTVSAGDNVYFAADDGIHGRELWKSDGTADGTYMVKDIHPSGSPFGFPFVLPGVDVGGALYFAANDGTNGTQVWRSNGTGAGTYPVTSLPPISGPNGQSNVRNLTSVDGKLYFVADDGIHGAELWVLGPDTELVARGDYDQDGDADGADFLKWQRNVGSRDATVDGDGSGEIDGGDLQVWEENFGEFGEEAAAVSVLALNDAEDDSAATIADAALAAFDSADLAGLANQWNDLHSASHVHPAHAVRVVERSVLKIPLLGGISAQRHVAAAVPAGRGKTAEALQPNGLPREQAARDADLTTALGEFDSLDSRLVRALR